MLDVQRRVYIKLAVTILRSITFVKLSYPTESVHLKAKKKKSLKMRTSCVLLVLAVLLSSTMAKPMAYVDRDGENDINNDYLQYLLHRHGNGMQIAIAINFVC